MKVIIVDDEDRARVSLRHLIIEFVPDLQIVAECDGIPNAVKAIHKYHPDLVFLDIEMPGHSGLEIMDFFDIKEVDFGIIFTTAYKDYAINAIKLSAIDYLLKPIDPDELMDAVFRFKENNLKKLKFLNQDIRSERKIGIPLNNGIELINSENILYIKGEGAYSEVTLLDGKKILASKNLKMFEDSLQHYDNMIRVHKSYIINFNYLVSINKSNGGTIILNEGTEIPFNTESYDVLLEKINMIRK